MPLEKVFVPVDLSGGVDTKTDQKMVLPSSLTELENGVFTTGTTITKRKGYSKLRRNVSGPAGTSSISSGDALARFQNELLLFSDSTLYSYTSGREEWISKGGSRSVTVESSDLMRNDYEQSQPDISYGNGLFLFAWESTSGGVRASVQDAVSGAMLQNNTLISSTGVLPKCIELNGTVCVVYVETTGTDSIAIRMLDPADPTTFTTAGTLANNAATSEWQLDAITYQSNAGLFAYANSSGTITVAYITQSGETGTALNGYVAASALAGCDAEDSLTIYHDISGLYDDDIYLAYSKNSDSSGLILKRLNFDLTVADTETVEASATQFPRVTLGRDSAGDIVVFYEVYAALDYNRYIKTRTYDISASAWKAAASNLKLSVGLASKAFYYSDKTYVLAIHASDLQSTYFLMDGDGLVVAKLQASVAGGILADSTLASVVDDYESGVFKLPVQIKTRLESSGGDIYSLKGLSLSSVDFTKSDSFLAEELGQNLHIAGGFISAYDSQDIVELGFHLYPENVSAAVSSGGSLIASKAYQHRVVYLTTDAAGQIHRSAPSVATSSDTTGSDKTITLTIPTLRITEHPVVTIDVYRTVGDGTIFYKCGSKTNSTTADTVTFVDDGAASGTDASVPDSTLTTQELLYTTGNIVGNVAPPATSVIGSFNNRLFAVSSENPKLLFYSKKRLRGAPVEFSDVFYTVMNRADKITALAEMDEKLIIFEERRIFYVTGDGPNNAGEQNSFSEPQLITGDVGCTNADAVVQTPDGIMFMSLKGIYILTRGMQTEYIGAPVEAFNSETMTSAVLLQDTGQVRFTTSAGPALVYDLFYRKWSTFTNHSGTGAVVWKATGNYCYLRTSGGLVYEEDSTRYTDVDAMIQMQLTTAWIKPDSIQGYQRCRRALLLGDYKSNHTLEARVAYNFRQYFNEVHKFNFVDDTSLTDYGADALYGDTVYGGLSDGVYQFRMGLGSGGPQKCDAIRFQFQDTVASDPGQSYSVTNLMIEIGLKTTPMKLPATKST